MSRTSEYFDYRRQRFNIYFVGMSADTIIKQYALWLSKFFKTQERESYDTIEWFIAVKTDEEYKALQSINKYFNIIVTPSDKPMEELFKAFPVKFNQYIYVLVFEPFIPPDFWNKIFLELYMSKRFTHPLRYIKSWNYEIPVCLGKHIRKHPEIIRRRYSGTYLDFTKAKNTFRKII